MYSGRVGIGFSLDKYEANFSEAVGPSVSCTVTAIRGGGCSVLDVLGWLKVLVDLSPGCLLVETQDCFFRILFFFSIYRLVLFIILIYSSMRNGNCATLWLMREYDVLS